MSKNQVFVCGTYFHIYISVLKALYREDKNIKTLLILDNHTPDIESIIPRLEQSGFFDHVTQIPFRDVRTKIRKSGVFRRNFNRSKNEITFVDTHTDISKYDEFIRNSEINLFYNLGLTSSYFISKYPNNTIRLVEDGEANYHTKLSFFKVFKRKYILNTFIGEGIDQEVNEIEVQHPEKINSRILHKGKKLELQKMQDGLTPEQSNKILDVFLDGHGIDFSGSKKLLLITQPFSEDRYFDEDRKVQLYNELLEPYAAEYTIFIKAHPRELTDYKNKIVYDFVDIPRAFPLEMFNLLKNIRFDIGLTMFSSGINNLNCIDKKIILGMDAFEKIKKKYLLFRS